MKKADVQSGKTSFELIVNKVPYLIDVRPFTFNDEARFEINVNGGEGHIFAWDTEIVGLRAIDDAASTLPDELEQAISEKLVKTVPA